MNILYMNNLRVFLLLILAFCMSAGKGISAVRSAGNSAGHFAGHSAGHTAWHIAGQSAGHFAGHFTLHSAGHFAGQSAGNSFTPAKLSTEMAEPADSPVEFISYYFENGSPLFWEYNPDGSVTARFLYDKERSSPNRQTTHVFFQVQAKPGSEVTLVLEYFHSVWNGRRSAPFRADRSYYISADGREWTAVPAQVLENNAFKLNFIMDTGSTYVTGMEPYRLSDLDNFLGEIAEHPLVEISNVGNTVEGRQLEIIRIGNPDAPYSVFLRARSHPWESGGNWVVQGLVKSLLDENENNSGYLDRYCVYIMPMANKDGVARGMTRFNLMGKDLNRDWDSPADPHLSPENHFLEKWLQEMIDKGKKPDLAIDLHNDSQGNLLASRPEVNPESYLSNMERLESMLLKYTWFTEGLKHGFSYGSIGSGLVDRFGIDCCTYELNQLWIAGLNKVPYGADWELLGSQLRDAFFHYFDDRE